MPTKTPNIKLNVPDFDQVPWDVDVDQNWTILDATVGQFFGVNNFVGVWTNSTLYIAGQTAVDPDGSMWMATTTHTSAASPSTFAQDRTARPGLWTQTQGTAASSAKIASDAAASALSYSNGATLQAQNAANSAQQAADSAAAAAGQANTSLPLAGGVMTGPITLAADPAAVMQPATKQYVDARVGGTGFLPTTGGTLTGPLLLSGDPTTALGAVTKQYSDAHMASVVAGYLPLSGGTVTGALTVNGQLNTTTGLHLTSSGAYFATSTAVTQIVFDSGLWRFEYTRSSGAIRYLRGYDNVANWTLDPGGNMTVPGQVYAGGPVVAVGALFARGGTIYLGTADKAYFQSDNATYTNWAFINTGWRLQWNWGDATLRYYNDVSAELWHVDGGGNGVYTGNLTSHGSLQIDGNANITNTLTANYVTATQTVNCFELVCNDTVNAANAVFAANGTMQMNPNAGSGRILQIAGSWYWDWHGSGGQLDWTTPSGAFLTMNPGNWLINNEIGPMGGHGAYQNTSDERVKTNITPTTYGLPEILQINPIRFNRLRTEREEVGFSAQQLQPILPHAVRDDLGDMMTVNDTTIVAALVNAVKELEARLATVEAR
jgi:hypothetical protein